MAKIDKWGMEEKYWEDFALGSKTKTVELTFSEDHLTKWGHLTGDWHPLHFSEEYAKTTAFGTRVSPGALVVSLAIGLVISSGYLGNSLIAYLGMDNVRFLAPVKIGDTIFVETEIINRKETGKVDQGIVVSRWTVKNQRGEGVAVMDHNFMMHRGR